MKHVYDHEGEVAKKHEKRKLGRERANFKKEIISTINRISTNDNEEKELLTVKEKLELSKLRSTP